MTTDGRGHFVLLLFAAATLFFIRLDLPLLEPEESRYAEIPRQMLTEGRFAIPVYHGENYLHKPPLLYWLVIGSYRIFGVHDWAARLVPALAGIVTVLAAFSWWRRSMGSTAAFWGALVLVLSPRFVYQAGILGMDGLLCLWVVLGWGASERALNEDGMRGWVLTGLAAGLGILTKGPVALALIAGPGILWQLWRRELRVARWLLAAAVALAAAVPWFWSMWREDPAAFRDFFLVHHWQRFLEPLDHPEPAWFYVPYIVLGMMPWVLAPLRLAPELRHASAWDSVHARLSASRLNGLLVLAFVVTFVLFSASGCKRPGYILPAFVPLAGLIGLTIRDTFVARLSAGTVFVLLLVAFAAWLPAYHRRFGLRDQVVMCRERVANEKIDVVAYPKRWDSIAFYLKRNDVRVLDDESWTLTGPTLVFVKHGTWFSSFSARIAPGWKWETISDTGPRLRVGIVRPASILAE